MGLGLRVIAAAVALALGAPVLARHSDHEDREHRFVRISDGKLTPREITLHATQAIAWGNYTAKAAVITFDREVAGRIICEEPGSFRLTATHLVSSRILPRQFASLCRLAPGRYDYRVELFGTPGSAEREPALEGVIVVEP